MARRLRLGMVGGGRGAFIGAVHRAAARLDDQWELVAGALSSDPETAISSARDLGIAPDRAYRDFRQMAAAEAARADGIDAVAVTVPNHLHAAVTMAFLETGIHVICDKPLAATLEEAERIAEAVDRSEKCFILTHNYTGYPMVRHAAEIVRRGDLGKIRLVNAEYVQDWLAEDLENRGNRQAAWRTDPTRSGAGGSIGDIGTHAWHLINYVTGLRTTRLSADLARLVHDRRLDDNAHVMLQFEGGARGLLWSSQVAVGNENAFRLRVFGDRGGLEWFQETPNHLLFTPLGGAQRRITRNGPEATAASRRVSRTPPGHPEGWQEAFATIYAEAARIIRAHRDGAEVSKEVHAPGLSDGLHGMRFIAACVASSRADAQWVELVPGR